MGEAEMLQLILTKLDSVEKNQAKLADDIKSLEQVQKAQGAGIAKIAVTLENDVQKKLNLLEEGQQSLWRQMQEQAQENKQDHRGLENMIVDLGGKLMDLEGRVLILETASH